MSELLGAAAAGQIRDRFAQSSSPEEAIRDIQRDYGLNMLPGMEAIYMLLDLSGCKRAEVHSACLEALNRAVVARIQSPEFGEEEFIQVFQRSLSYIAISELQPIPMALLEKFASYLDQDTLEALKQNLDVFEQCPVNVKQRIWKQDESFFQEQILQMLNMYHYDDDLQEAAMNLRPDSYQDVLSTRRLHPIVNKLMEIINGDPKLYSMVLNTIHIVFQSSPFPSLCSIRVDLLMNYHEKDNAAVLKTDKCHRLIWSLDTCVRTQNMDGAIIEKIKECFDDVKNGTPLYTDYAMVLMDPIISNFLSACIMKWLRISVDDDVPEDLEQLIKYSAKLLNLAEQAPMAARTQQKIPKIDKNLTDCWSSLCAIMLMENNNKGSVKPSDTEILRVMLSKSEIARKVFVQYCIDRTFEGDIMSLQRLLPFILETLPVSNDTNAAHVFIYESFIHTFIGILNKKWLVECVMDDKWKTAVFNGFLIHIVRWSAIAHKEVVVLLTKCFAGPKLQRLLDEKIGLIAEWVDRVCQEGYKDEKVKHTRFINFKEYVV
ncbi:cofactor of BRCA1-domain-containing protein [Zychaea mexicana]|uniref:cofactor of BRCA1-domain-containing protein n=1 Tax=Zychaea mexicana TaxID=64656 RepID=UPI0022FDB94A|nr:cofactor of BRCA1-domain-containing protein [Zychaea mexicana]KAI9494828.1 cofactor of BRCA1-domain-containing protein [Zychaea mexicana]